MKRRKIKQMPQEAPLRGETPAWYATNAFKIGAALGGIFIVAFLLFVLSIDPSSATGRSGSGGAASGSDAQVVRMAVVGAQFTPSAITVQAGKPVRWIVDGTQASGCTQYLVAPAFGVSQRLQKGENVIEFVPTQKGTFGFACGMGMVEGTITVI